jgi:hypothetical protein
LGEYGRQYADLLTFVALEPRDTFSKQELVEATELLPQDGLQNAAQTLVRLLEGAGERRVEHWQNRVEPYLRHIWPKSREAVTADISDSFARLCIAAGDAFPDAFGTLRHWPQPLPYPELIVRLLDEAKLCEQFPHEALKFLDVVIGEPQWAPTRLRACLDAIGEAAPDLRKDNRLQRLHQLLPLRE